MDRFLPGILAAVACSLLGGCGTTSYEVIDSPTRPFKTYGPLQALQVEIEAKIHDDGKVPFSTVLANEIQERLTDEEFFAGSGSPLMMRCRLTRYEAEYAPAKLWGGGGGMNWGRVVLDVEFSGPDRQSAGRVRATGFSKRGGWAIASMDAAQRRAIKALINFIDDHFDEVPPPR